MTTKIKYLTAVAAIALMTASSAFAGEIEVGGNAVNFGVVVGNAVNLALGEETVAEQNIGVVSGDSDVVAIDGNLFNFGIVGGNAVNVAFGLKSTACQDIGSIGNAC